jgi:ribosome-binding protein aMBF1 (putative translation factor)
MKRNEHDGDSPVATRAPMGRKLSPDQVRHIRALSEEGWSQQKLAEKFDVKKNAIYYLLSGRTHKAVL